MGKTGRGAGVGAEDGWIKPGDRELGDDVTHNKCFSSIYFLYRYSNFEMEITILVTLTMLIIRGEANSGLVITKINKDG